MNQIFALNNAEEVVMTLNVILMWFSDCVLSVKTGGAWSEMAIVVGNGHGDTSSNPGRDWLHFTLH